VTGIGGVLDLKQNGNAGDLTALQNSDRVLAYRRANRIGSGLRRNRTFVSSGRVAPVTGHRNKLALAEFELVNRGSCSFGRIQFDADLLSRNRSRLELTDERPHTPMTRVNRCHPTGVVTMD